MCVRDWNLTPPIPLLLCLVFVLAACMGIAPALAVESDILTRAEAAYAAKDFGTASSLFTDHYNSLPTCSGDIDCKSARVHAMLRITQCMSNRNKILEARSWAKHLLDTYASDTSLLSGSQAAADEMPEAQYLLGSLLKQEGLLNDAAAELEKVSNYQDRGWACMAVLLKAECEMGLERLDSALSTYSRLLVDFADKDSACSQARKGIVKTLVEKAASGGTTAKVAALDKILNDQQADQETREYTALLKTIYLRQEPPPIDTATTTAMDLGRKAAGVFGRAEYAEAAYIGLQHYNAFLGCDEHSECRMANAASIIERGVCYLRLKEWESARSLFQQVLTKYPSDTKSCAEAQSRIAESYQEEGRTTMAIAAADKLVSDYSPGRDDKAAALMTKSWRQIQGRKFADAKATLELLTATYPEAPNLKQAQILLQDAKIASGERTEAVEDLRALLSDPSYSRDELGRINLLLGIGELNIDKTKAEEQLGIVMEQFPGTAHAHEAALHRSLLRSMRGAYTEAAADVQLIQMPGWRAYAQGYLLYTQGHYADAATSFAQVVSGLPTPLNVPWDIPIRSFWYLEKCYDRLGNTAAAEDARGRLAKFKESLPLSDPDTGEGGKAR